MQLIIIISITANGYWLLLIAQSPCE